ncbi:hypothetical protein ECZU03_55900 [Escherichia coli]|nr:hypothetical protein ECZU03_55900 [Escherichia coli]
MGALTRRAEGGGSGRVENKIASVVVAQGLQQLACRLRFYRENGSQLVVIKLLQGRVSQYASGMNRSGNAAVGRQIVKNRGQLPGIATSQRQTRVCPPSTSRSHDSSTRASRAMRRAPFL